MLKAKNGRAFVVHTPLISAVRRQKQVDLCDFKANLVYKASSRTHGQEQSKIKRIDFNVLASKRKLWELGRWLSS